MALTALVVRTPVPLTVMALALTALVASSESVPAVTLVAPL